MTAVVYVHDRFTVKTAAADVGAAIQVSVMLNDRDRANEITVFIHKSKRKCGSHTDSGPHIMGLLNVLQHTVFSYANKSLR